MTNIYDPNFFIAENRLTQDKCALLTKELQNKSVEDYNLYNFYSTSQCPSSQDECYQNKMEKFNDFVLTHPNLRYKDGYGNFNSCVIDNDSDIRLNRELTNFREKEQLCTRWSKAIPNYGRGGAYPNIESRLKYAEDTSIYRDCDRIVERDFNRFIPLSGTPSACIQNPSHIILPFERGGESTRDYVRDENFDKKCFMKIPYN